MTAFVVQLNQRLDQIADMFYRIGELSGDTLRLTGNLDLGGKRVMNVGATRTDNDAPSRGELRRKSLYVDATGRLRSNAPIEANGGIEVPRALQQTDAISLGQIQETIAAAIAIILATVAPPKVADASAVGTATKVARQDHTHEGVNLDDAQVIVGAKTFDRDPAAPFVVTATSAVVPNLDADKLDGNEATAFTLNQAVAYTESNVTTDRSYDADLTSLNELADVLGTLIADLRAGGFLL